MTSQVRNLRCRSIGVREATDLIRMVSVSGRVGWGGVGWGGGGGGGGGSHRLALCQLRSKVIQSYK